MGLDELLAARPLLHRDGDRRVSFALADEVLRFIDSTVGDGQRTLETGAGVSTVLFALKRADHTCIVPFASEVDDIRHWCAENQIPTDRVTFVVASSEDALPNLEPTPLDLVLIDGAHAFPIPFIDWYYAGRRLRLGGKLVIDDTQLWTGKILRAFLREQPGWELVWELTGRSVAFERTGDQAAPYWPDQPYVVKRSRTGEGRAMTRNAVSMLRRGDLRTFGQKLRKHTGRSELRALARDALARFRR